MTLYDTYVDAYIFFINIISVHTYIDLKQFLCRCTLYHPQLHATAATKAKLS